MAGRPTVFNAAVLETIVREIRRGAFDWVAAEAAGIDRRTFYRWMKRGDQGEAPFAELKAQVDHDALRRVSPGVAGKPSPRGFDREPGASDSSA